MWGFIKKAADWVDDNVVEPVKKAAKDVVDTAKGGVKTIFKTYKKWGEAVGKAVASGVSTVYKDTKQLVTAVASGTKDLAEDVVGLGGKIVDKTADTVQSVGSSLMMPLLIGAGVVGGLYLMKG